MKQYKKSLFIFRRDLRLSDNTALIEVLKSSELVIPCFIFDPRQVVDNDYKSDNALQFMIESLLDLQKQLKKHNGKLYFFFGTPQNVIQKLIKDEKIEAIYFNKDYTPFSKKRDDAIKKISQKYKADCLSFDDALLCPPGSVLKPDGLPYSIFTPFYKKALQNKIALPKKNNYKNFYTKPIKNSYQTIPSKVEWHDNKNILVHGGRDNAKKIFKHLEELKNYKKEHDFPAIATSGLGAHNKFGTFSIREIYFEIAKKLDTHHPLIRQLYWRDFFTLIALYFPYVFGHPFHKKYEKVKWSNNKKLFKAWCEGKTGFPIVDAGMRQLNTTGFMHNRVRMIVASFLTKDLHIDWRAGEKYFAQKLVDYDPAVNNGNWQWTASVGADAQPYFRIFNPWTQQKKFDAQCKYIKGWVPELKNIDIKMIHNWNKIKTRPQTSYPEPIVDHAIESRIAKEMYKKIS